MKRKISELEGRALDWAVAKANGLDFYQPDYGPSEPEFSTDWAQGGPIIERDLITVEAQFKSAGYECPLGQWYWVATMLDACGDMDTDTVDTPGPTPLVAAMRCYVASKLGNTVDIPDSLNDKG